LTGTGLSGARLRRFYKSATAAEVPGGYAVFLDSRQLKTPAGGQLVLARRSLAEALAEEWQAQEGDIQPRSMRLMQLVSTAIDRVAIQRAEVVEEVAGYGATDLVCYRVNHPEELARRQQALWQPLVDWATLQYDAPLTVTTAILPLRQPEGALAALKAAVGRLDSLTLTGLHAAVAACGSLVLGLALLEGRLSAADAWEAAQLEEAWQMEHWGEDAEAARRRAALREDLEAAARFLDLLRG
jgi:chaperone required for assembly of F1-ATPase